MLKIFFNSSGLVLRLTAAVGINFILFIILPFTHNLFAKFSTNDLVAEKKNRLVAEYIRPPEKKKKVEPQRHIRQIKSSTSSKSVKSAMDFKFTPDLGVESGDGAVLANRSLDAVVFEEGEAEEDAVPLYTPGVRYPVRARELGIEGMLEAIIVISTDGSIASVEIRTSPHPSMTAEAKKVFSEWKFKPAQNQGVPVMVRKKQVIEFKLNS